jgi:hypothetical protein
LHGKVNHATGEDVKRAHDADEAEKRFLEKVEFELSLPEYTTFSESFSLDHWRNGEMKCED